MILNVAHAQAITNPQTLLSYVMQVLNVVIQILFILALLYFIWAVISYAFKKSEDREESKQIMINGLIALFVIATVWGLVGILKSVVADRDAPVSCPANSCTVWPVPPAGINSKCGDKCYPFGTDCSTIPNHCKFL